MTAATTRAGEEDSITLSGKIQQIDRKHMQTAATTRAGKEGSIVDTAVDRKHKHMESVCARTVRMRCTNTRPPECFLRMHTYIGCEHATADLPIVLHPLKVARERGREQLQNAHIEYACKRYCWYM